MNPNEINKKMLSSLPRGATGTIARRARVSRVAVYKVLHNKWNNPKVWKHTYKILADQRDAINDLLNKHPKLNEYGSESRPDGSAG